MTEESSGLLHDRSQLTANRPTRQEESPIAIQVKPVSLSLGILWISERAKHACRQRRIDPLELIVRHASADYGDLPAEYVAVNERNIWEKGVLASLFREGKETFAVVTPKGHELTYLILMDEYKCCSPLLPYRPEGEPPGEHVGRSESRTEAMVEAEGSRVPELKSDGSMLFPAGSFQRRNIVRNGRQAWSVQRYPKLRSKRP